MHVHSLDSGRVVSLHRNWTSHKSGAKSLHQQKKEHKKAASISYVLKPRSQIALFYKSNQ